VTPARQTQRPPVRSRIAAGAFAIALLIAAAVVARSAIDPPEAPADQLEAYRARRPKSVLELQPFRETTRIEIQGAGGRRGAATLIDLAPHIRAWLLLTLAWEDGEREGPFHLENPAPRHQRVRLDEAFRGGLVLSSEKEEERCPLWSGTAAGALAAARSSGRVYAPLCGRRLYLRNRAEGRKTALEWTTDFLRDHVWQGEQISNFVREHFYGDAFYTAGELVARDGAVSPEPLAEGAPRPAQVDPARRGVHLRQGELGIELAVGEADLEAGQWYAARGVPAVFASIIRPDLVDKAIAAQQRGLVNALDEVESRALVYTLAFDLAAFDLAFEMGTEHPRVVWADRARPDMRDPTLPGPDGIDSLDPLVMTGMVVPPDRQRAVATIAGGFRRRHGAFRYSYLATRNEGSHYGFVEQGVILSKLQPGLATLVVWDDGRVELRTWTEADDARLWHVRHARQNGVPLLEPDPETGSVRPGVAVRFWGAGNWSGSQEGRLRSVRAGACLQENGERRFLLYGYFSSVTPSAMARVFAAYGCRYAIHLDMNALEHTYLALYRHEGRRLHVDHLVKGMQVLDEFDGRVVPRFLGSADNRDFFTLLQRRRP